ncbi:FtsX-like permease family protein [Terrabacter sp. BE26]|uniref:FtsX-like permease family protein n=1 Tax=Terrabacter sp. BE26 TaxID=2898152 RepID=UPI0035BE5DE8
MREQTLGNAWANVTGRRVASLTTVVIVASLMAALVALLVPLHDVRANIRAQYDDPSWRSTFLVEGLAGASEPMGPAEIDALAKVPGVTSVTPVDTVEGPAGDDVVQLRTYVPVLDVPIVQGRAPRAGQCEAAVTRDVAGARLGTSVRVGLGEGGQAAGGGLEPLVVGIIDHSYPLVNGATMLTTCRLPHRDSASQVVVTTRSGQLPKNYVAQSLSSAAAQAMDSSQSTGILGLVALLIAVVSLFVVASVARWSVRSRLGEFVTLRVWGRSRRTVVGMVGVEQAILAIIAAPIGLGLGTLLAWWLVRAGGPSGLVDPAAGIAVAAPSPWTLAVACGGFLLALVLLTALPVVRVLRPDVASLLRRRGE